MMLAEKEPVFKEQWLRLGVAKGRTVLISQGRNTDGEDDFKA